jgi:SAM-dependent methyltransferase
VRGLSRPVRRRLRPAGWGDARSLEPVSRKFGLDRGTAVDRYYIERHLSRHSGDIRGRVLEIGDRAYTVKFGGDRVLTSEVLHASPGDPEATLVGDLTSPGLLGPDTFETIILTQTISFIYDFSAALRSCHRALAPGGVLLVTTAGISQISRYDMERWGDYWRFTDLSVRRVVGEIFTGGRVEVECYGNVLSACALLRGLAAEELRREELDHGDHDYQVIIGIRAQKRDEIARGA